MREIKNGIVSTRIRMLENESADYGEKTVEVHFERATDNGFDTARCTLPSYKWIKREGFSDDEIKFFEDLLHSNAHLFFKYAETGGIKIA